MLIVNVGHANHNNYDNVALMGTLSMEISFSTVLVLNVLAKAQAIYCALHAVRIFTSSFCTKFVGHCYKIAEVPEVFLPLHRIPKRKG